MQGELQQQLDKNGHWSLDSARGVTMFHYVASEPVDDRVRGDETCVRYDRPWMQPPVPRCTALWAGNKFEDSAQRLRYSGARGVINN